MLEVLRNCRTGLLIRHMAVFRRMSALWHGVRFTDKNKLAEM